MNEIKHALHLLELEHQSNILWTSLSSEEKKIYQSLGATLFKPQPGYNKANPLNSKDKIPTSEDWGKPTEKYPTPIERKGYLTGAGSPMNTATSKAQIGSRLDYHKASKAFHEGKAASLFGVKNRNEAQSQQLRFHQQAADIHSNAANTYDPSSTFHSAYPKHLENLQKHYVNMDKHAKSNGMQIGAGHTKFVTK